MLPDGAKSKTVGALYILEKGTQERIKIGNGTLESTEMIYQKERSQEVFAEIM